MKFKVYFKKVGLSFEIYPHPTFVS